jgi:hypothetical protein
MQLDAADALTVAVVCGPDIKLPELRKKILPLMPKQFPFTLIRVPDLPRNAMGRIPRQAVAKRLAEQMKARVAAKAEKEG